MSRVVGGGWHRTVELHEGEQLLYEHAAIWWDGGWWGGSATGKLYVTDQRFIWARDRLTLPIPRQSVLLIAVGDILDAEVYRRVLGVQTEERKYWFKLFTFMRGWPDDKQDLEECRDMIEKAIRSNETPG